MDLALAVLRREVSEVGPQSVTPASVAWLLAAAEIASIDEERVIDALIVTIELCRGFTDIPEVNWAVLIMRKLGSSVRKLETKRDTFDGEHEDHMIRAFSAVIERVQATG